MPDRSRSTGTRGTQSRGEWSGEIRTRLAALALDAAREAEIVEELSQHLEEEYEELRARTRAGWPCRSCLAPRRSPPTCGR